MTHASGRIARLPVVLIAALFVVPASAQVPNIAERPDFRVGDSWQFEQDAPDGKTNWSRTITGLEAGLATVRFDDGTLHTFDRDMNALAGNNPEHPIVRARYPMRVGDSWEFSSPYADPGVVLRGTGRVVGFETVAVPAGTFDCYRVDIEWSIGAQHWERYESASRWYCPQIRWIAKEVHTRRTRSDFSGPTGNTTTTASSVLMHFDAGR